MKIIICGSMSFAQEMIIAKKNLEMMSHEVLLPYDTEECAKNSSIKSSFENDLDGELAYCLEKDLLKNHFDKIEEGDAILHLNYAKHDIEGYLGAAGLMEIAVAFHRKKKIFLLNDIDRNQKCAMEILLTKPTILNGNLKLIK
jgi:hypothetical protein